MDCIDWDLLALYIPPADTTLDIDEELNSSIIRNRDVGYSTSRNEPTSDGGEALRLLAELNGLSENERPSRMEEGIPAEITTDTRRRTKATETTQEKSSSSGDHPVAAMQWMRIGGCYRRCPPRPVRVHTLWPDPATGCVYGGGCALQLRSSNEYGSCSHPPVQSDRAFQNSDSLDAGRLPPNDRRRDPVAFASRARWQTLPRYGRPCEHGPTQIRVGA